MAEPGYQHLVHVYEALDSRNYRQALKQIQQIQQKKFPNSYLLKALKAFALYWTQKREEASQLVSEVLSVPQIDDAVLSPMSMILKLEERWQDLSGMYSRAVAANPNDVELAQELFFSCVRAGDYKEMLKTAQMLFRKTTQFTHLQWTVASLFMQAEHQEQIGKGQGALQYTLTARLIEKMFTDRPQEVKQEMLWLYIDVMTQQGKDSEAIDICCSEIGDTAFSLRSIQFETLLGLYSSSGNWKEANALSKHMLDTYDKDNWEYFKIYFKSLPELATEGPVSSVVIPLKQSSMELDVDSDFEKALVYVKKLVQDQEEGDAKRKLRGPYLGLMELYMLIIKYSQESCQFNIPIPLEEAQAALKVLLESYIIHFGSKVTCFLDVAQYIHNIFPAAEGQDFLASLRQKMTENPQKTDPKEKQIWLLQVDITLRKLAYAMGLHQNCSPAETISTCEELVGLYCNALPLNEGLEKTERGWGDDYIVLAVVDLMTCYCKTHDPQLCLRGLCYLEYATQHVKHNFYFNILKLLLYSQLGCSRFDLLSVMEVKNVMMDTLTYLFMPSLDATGQWKQLEQLMTIVATFHRNHKKTAPDDMANVFQYNSFTKIREFLKFKERLRNSILRLESTTRLILTNLSSSSTPEKVREILASHSEEMSGMQTVCTENIARTNEDLAVIDIMLPYVKDSHAVNEIRKSFLPHPVPLEDSIPGRIANCRFTLGLIMITGAMAYSHLSLETASSGKKGKGRKGRNKTEDEATPQVDSNEESTCPYSMSEAMKWCEEGLTQILAANHIKGTKSMQTVYAIIKACGHLHDSNADVQASLICLKDANTKLNEYIAETKQAMASCSRDSQHDFNGFLPDTARHLPIVMMSLSWTAKVPHWKKDAQLKQAQKEILQSLIGWITDLESYASRISEGDRAQVWERRHHSNDVITTLQNIAERDVFDSSIEQVLQNLNQGVLGFHTSQRVMFAECLTDLKHLSKQL